MSGTKLQIVSNDNNLLAEFSKYDDSSIIKELNKIDVSIISLQNNILNLHNYDDSSILENINILNNNIEKLNNIDNIHTKQINNIDASISYTYAILSNLYNYDDSSILLQLNNVISDISNINNMRNIQLTTINDITNNIDIINTSINVLQNNILYLHEYENINVKDSVDLLDVSILQLNNIIYNNEEKLNNIDISINEQYINTQNIKNNIILISNKVETLSTLVNKYSIYNMPVIMKELAKHYDFSEYPLEIYIPYSIKDKVKTGILFTRYNLDTKSIVFILLRYSHNIQYIHNLCMHSIPVPCISLKKSEKYIASEEAHYFDPIEKIDTALGEYIYIYISLSFQDAIIKYSEENAKERNITSGNIELSLYPCNGNTVYKLQSNFIDGTTANFADKYYHLDKKTLPNIYEYINNVKQKVLFNETLDNFVNTKFNIPGPNITILSTLDCISEDDIVLNGYTMNNIKADMHINISALNFSKLDNLLFIISGNNHILDLYTSCYKTLIINNKAVATIDITSYIPHFCTSFVDQDFNIYLLSLTDFWEADTYILGEDKKILKIGETDTTSYKGKILYIPINSEWINDNFITNNIYITWSAWFYSFYNKVDSIEDIELNGLIHKFAKITFNDNTGSNYKPDSDRRFSNNTPNVKLYNCYNKSNDVWISEDNKVYFPINVNTVYILSNNIYASDIYIVNANIICGNYNNYSMRSYNMFIDNSKFNHFITLYASHTNGSINKQNSYLLILNTEIMNSWGYAVNADRYTNDSSYLSYLHIHHCNIHNSGQARLNTGGIGVALHSHIHHNRIVDNGYASILGGTNWLAGGLSLDNYTLACIEYNTVGLTPEYFRNAYNYVMSDTGCIHIMTTTNGVIIRYNTINRFNGRGSCRGIFGDDGCSSIYVYGNIIRQTSKGYSIDIRYATGRVVPDTLLYNGHRVVACNIVDAPIRCCGIPNKGDTSDVKIFSNLEFNNINTEYQSDVYTDTTLCKDNIINNGYILSDGTIYTDIDYSSICTINTPFNSNTYIKISLN